jgi:hypothetical protein
MYHHVLDRSCYSSAACTDSRINVLYVQRVIQGMLAPLKHARVREALLHLQYSEGRRMNSGDVARRAGIPTRAE